MKIFVTGATGVIGRRVVPQLIRAGHQVTGLARTDHKAGLLRQFGAIPVQVDLFDTTALTPVLAGHEVPSPIWPPMFRRLNGRWSRQPGICIIASATRRPAV